MVEFVSLSKAEAKEYLEQFLLEMPSALERLRSHSSATGGPGLDGSVASLDELWAWARPRFQCREGYVPPALGQPGARITADELEPADALPSWFHHPSAAGHGGLGGDEQSPLHTCGILVGRALRPESVPGVQSLRDVYLSWTSR